MKEIVLAPENKISIEEACKNNAIIATVIANDVYVLRENEPSVFNFYELIKGNMLSITNYKVTKAELITSLIKKYNYKLYYFNDNVEFLSWASQQVLPF